MNLDPDIVAALRAEQARGWQRWGQTTIPHTANLPAPQDAIHTLVDAVAPEGCYIDDTESDDTEEPVDITPYFGRDGKNIADRVAALRRPVSEYPDGAA